MAEFSSADDHLDFSGWITLANQSGTAYPNATLQLVAGDLNRVRQRPLRPKVMGMAEMSDAAAMKQESLFEYHLYTLPRPATLAKNQAKQVALMPLAHVPIRKEFLLSGADYYYLSQDGGVKEKPKVGIFVEFQNKGDGLGIPLPGGIVRFYKKDSEGNLQFVGEDQIDHTPGNGSVRVKLGEAFDVTADRKQTDFRRLAGEGRHTDIFEAAFQIVLKNAKKDSVTVIVREPVPGDWTMVSESKPHTKVESGAAEWKLSIPADGERTLIYRVRVKI